MTCSPTRASSDSSGALIQDFDDGLSSWAARVHVLQEIGESGAAQEMLPADVMVDIDGAVEDLNSLRSTFLQEKQECAEHIAVRVRDVIRQLQHWSQTPPPSQAALDEVWTELEETASAALRGSTCALEGPSKSPVSPGRGEVELDDKETAGGTCERGRTSCSG
ncbi:unnamed protein product [Pleuronectes platessa]|uniref:Uncharacterized protein n=1 Tax=Pleuronectes platessa TaxID=8262 RepID=A0A9N7TJ04_PLEPL|nr:unnamed protein product [Pleuronectes platessa]